jgi:hypothetical protein
MMEDWQIMAAVTRGTSYIRDLSETFLPQEPREDDDAYQTRVDRSVLSPYTSRLIETAAGSILRKPIQIDGDDYWKELSENIDGLGSDLNEYARRALVSSLTYGHSAILVVAPETLPKSVPWDVALTSSTSMPRRYGAGVKSPLCPEAPLRKYESMNTQAVHLMSLAKNRSSKCV